MALFDLIGAGIDAIGKYKAAQGAVALDNIQQQIYATNAGIQQQNATNLEGQATVDADAGNLSVSRIQTQGAETIAKQRNFFSSSNVDPTYGSPLLTMARTASRVASDADIARAGAALQSANDKTQAAGAQGAALGSLLNEAGANMKASSDLTAGIFGAATALLTGIGKIGFGSFSDSGSTSSGGSGGGGSSGGGGDGGGG